MLHIFHFRLKYYIYLAYISLTILIAGMLCVFSSPLFYELGKQGNTHWCVSILGLYFCRWPPVISSIQCYLNKCIGTFPRLGELYPVISLVKACYQISFKITLRCIILYYSRQAYTCSNCSNRGTTVNTVSFIPFNNSHAHS